MLLKSPECKAGFSFGAFRECCFTVLSVFVKETTFLYDKDDRWLPAILAQVAATCLKMIAVTLWLLHHVSLTECGYAHVENRRRKDPLPDGGRCMGVLCGGGRRSWTGFEIACQPPHECDWSCFGWRPPQRNYTTLRGPGFPCGACMEFGEEDTSCEKRWRLGFMGACNTIPGDLQRNEGSSYFPKPFTSNFIQLGEEGENESSPGSKRRLRGLGGDGGHEGFVVSEVPHLHRRMAVGRRGTDHGADLSTGKADQNPKHSSICGLWSMGPLRPEGTESLTIPNLHPHIFGIHHERAPWPFKLRAMESMLQSSEVRSDHVGLCIAGGPALLRDADGTDDEIISHLLALSVCSRRTCKIGTFQQDKIKDSHGHQEWHEGATELGRTPTLGLCVQSTLWGRPILASSSPHPSSGLDGVREQRHTEDPSRISRDGVHDGRTFGYCASRGTKDKQPRETAAFSRDSNEDTKGGQKEKGKSRQGRAPEIQTKQRSQKGQEGQREGWQAILFWLEQWQWTMRGIAAWAAMRVSHTERTPLHYMPKSGTSKQILSLESSKEVIKTPGGEKEDNSGSTSKPQNMENKKSSSSSYYTYSEGPEEEEGDEGKGDDDSNEDPNAPHISTAKTLEEYLKCRVFIYIHHFAGTNDPLGKAILEEADFQGLKVKLVSVERDAGSGDLLLDEPFNTHLQWAQKGYVDGYHSGFPCGTYTRLRFREVEGLPKAVRTKKEPYGKKENNLHQQRECDDGTVMCCRSIIMAKTVAARVQKSTIKPPVSLENPPPSDHPDHLSAWELPEGNLKDQLKQVNFNTCAYEPQLPIGKRHYKPQQFVGTLLGMEALRKTCACGSRASHEAIVGKQKSKASGEYPKALCKQLAKIIVSQLKLMGREEFLKRKITKLEITITEKKEELKAKEERKEPSRASWRTPERPTRRGSPRAPRKRVKAERSGSPLRLRSRSPRRRSQTPPIKRSPSPSLPRPSSSGRNKTRRNSRSRSTSARRVTLKEREKTDPLWQGGEGKYGMLKKSTAKAADPTQHDYLGGMRHPFKVVQPLSNMLSTGLRVRAAWDSFVKQLPKALKVAEEYGTKDCELDPKMVSEWKSRLKKTLGANAPPKLKVLPKFAYKSPLDAELFEAWIRKANDPDVFTPEWIRNGAPLGIETEIPTANIFPPMGDNTHLDHLGPEELEDASSQMAKGAIENYLSVKEKPKDALIELERYKTMGYVKEIDENTVKKEMAGGTISRLGLIIKEKPEGIKRRIVLDLRRSGGNKKSTLPERLILPRPQDALASFREVYSMRKRAPPEERYSRELVVIDVSDAFMALGLRQEELQHALAPRVNSPGYYVFGALLFGYKTAPLLWSRVASQVSRLLQSLLQGDEGMHQTYLDDAIWILQGGLNSRNNNLAMILTTMAALGLKVATKKGERSSQVQWIGVRFSLSQDHVIVSLPEKYTQEVLQLLEGWQDKGMAPIAELRRACGKLSWLSGILPRTRWIVSTFYKVMHERLRDVSSGEEDRRRSNREDQRKKDGLFVVKQLDQARLWMIAYLKTAMGQPSKKYKLDISQYPRAAIMTDASPNAIGAVLLINNKMVRAISVKVTKAEASELGFEDKWNTSSCQGIMEALAVLIALKTWRKELASCRVTLQVQSDSLVALALTQRMSNADAALNFIGGEISVECERCGIEHLQAGHVPGTANDVADYLSRPEEWQSKTKPSELQDFPITKIEVTKDSSYYALPTPKQSPDLWMSSAAANAAWASIS